MIVENATLNAEGAGAIATAVGPSPSDSDSEPPATRRWPGEEPTTVDSLSADIPPNNIADEAVVGVKRGPPPETDRDPDPGAQPAKRHKAAEPAKSASSSTEVVVVAAAAA